MANINDFKQYLRGYDYTGNTPVIIDFYAEWCGPCRMLAPEIERLADEYQGRVKVLKVDVDKNTPLAAAASIRSIPTLFFISIDGEIERHTGLLPYAELSKKADALISGASNPR
ncbi:thioredoxin [Paramuribaculum intestinale]|uniref:thioredoxin n=1 Tax=Paramuribaculum intestinale TaxID=2094151 RepID=UPI00263B09DF|nr:thioredoxin [Paramuribaculum intestinale]